jgi:hypothetical protein
VALSNFILTKSELDDEDYLPFSVGDDVIETERYVEEDDDEAFVTHYPNGRRRDVPTCERLMHKYY